MIPPVPFWTKGAIVLIIFVIIIIMIEFLVIWRSILWFSRKYPSPGYNYIPWHILVMLVMTANFISFIIAGFLQIWEYSIHPVSFIFAFTSPIYWLAIILIEYATYIILFYDLKLYPPENLEVMIIILLLATILANTFTVLVIICTNAVGFWNLIFGF